MAGSLPWKDHFRARISFLTAEEGGRQHSCLQGYRPDFMYEDEPDRGWMIWPRFLDENGAVLADGSPIPMECEALMCILNDELRRSVHQERIEPGVRFRLCEGNRVVATGVVVAITRQFDP